MKNQIVFSILCVMLLMYCRQPDNTWSEIDIIKVRDDVEATLRQYHGDIERDGLLAELKYLDSTDQFSWYAPGFSGPIGYDSVVTILHVMAPMFPTIDHTWDSLVISPLSHSDATYKGVVTSFMTDISGNIDTVHFREEGKLIRRSDGWKLLSGKTVEVN